MKNVIDKNIIEETYLFVVLEMLHQMPCGVHFGMFAKCIEFLGTDAQQMEYL